MIVSHLKRQEAVERVRRAKEFVTRAARAAVDGLPLAAALGDAAMEELSEARADLAALDGVKERAP